MMKLHHVFLFCLILFGANSAFSESLYNEKTYRSLAGDIKAFRLGDSLTVLIMETSSATASADTGGKRNTDLGIGVGDSVRGDVRVGLKLSNDSDGRGTTQRVGKLLGQLTVTVDSIAPNGELWVKGEQYLEINEERQQIKLEGRVRPQDISENNTVVSSRIADASISYQGQGSVADRQKPSFWTRLFMWLGY
jgi:flagellar L-ring protein FlgH